MSYRVTVALSYGLKKLQYVETVATPQKRNRHIFASRADGKHLEHAGKFEHIKSGATAVFLPL